MFKILEHGIKGYSNNNLMCHQNAFQFGLEGIFLFSVHGTCQMTADSLASR